MIDEELLQELLAKASSLYNDGDYKGAVEAWSEILKVDPANTKAREGIQVSNLLMGEWDGAAAPSEPVVVEPADGPEPAANALTPEEVEAKLGEGIARVKKLLAEGRVPEALEGARGLIPIDPDSEEVQKIIEEAQQASEAAPFVEEHLTLARELMAQGRLAEAAGQCDKVLAVDRANPQAAALQAQIAGADDPSPPDTGTAEPVAPTDAPLELEMFDLPVPGPGGAEQKRDTTAAPTGSSPGDPAAEPAKQPDVPEVIEAIELVAPAVRTIPRPDPESEVPASALLEKTPGLPAAGPPAPAVPEEAEPAAWEAELAQLNLGEGEKDLLGDTPVSVTPDSGAEAEADADLMSLLDDDVPATPETAGGELKADLSAQESIPLARPAAPESSSGEGEAGVPAVATPVEPAPGDPAVPPSRQPAVPSAGDDTDLSVLPANPASQPSTKRPTVQFHDEPRSSIPKYFVLAGFVLLLAGAAVWWFFLQPVRAGGKGAPSGASAPPGGSAPGSTAGAAADGPLPTSIGNSSRKSSPPEPKQDGATASAAVGGSPGLSPPPKPAPAAEVPSPAEVRRRVSAHLARGRKLMARKDWRGAETEMRSAMALDPFNLDVRDIADRAAAEIAREEKALKQFAEVRQLFALRDYQNALWQLYRLPDDPALGNVDRYIRNAWYNWAVTSMKAGNNRDVLEKIDEALGIDPSDADAIKIRKFAERYSARARDQVYLSFANDHALRAIDH